MGSPYKVFGIAPEGSRRDKHASSTMGFWYASRREEPTATYWTSFLLFELLQVAVAGAP